MVYDKRAWKIKRKGDLVHIVLERTVMKDFVVVTCLAEIPGLMDKLNTALMEAAKKAGGRLSRIVTVDGYEQLEAVLPVPDYNFINVVLLHGVMDKENNVTMGASRFMTLMKNNPGKKYIYITPRKSRMLKLIENGYYDGIMVEDSFNVDVLADILAGNRTEEKAREYFGVVKKSVESEEKQETANDTKEQNEVIEDSMEEAQEEPVNDVMDVSADVADNESVVPTGNDNDEEATAESVAIDNSESFVDETDISLTESVEEPTVSANTTEEQAVENAEKETENTSQEEGITNVYQMSAEEPMFRFANYSGYVTRVTGKDTLEIRLTYMPGQAPVDLENPVNAAYLLGSVVNLPVVVGDTVNRKYSVSE